MEHEFHSSVCSDVFNTVIHNDFCRKSKVLASVVRHGIHLLLRKYEASRVIESPIGSTTYPLSIDPILRGRTREGVYFNLSVYA